MRNKFVIVLAVIAILLVGFAAVLMLPELDLFETDRPKKDKTEDKRPVVPVVAAQIGDHELDAIEMNYYYRDVIDENYQNWYIQYGSETAAYLQILMNLDVAKPLNEQVCDERTGQTWAERFVELALDDAKYTYVLCDLANAAGFKLDEKTKEDIDSQMNTLSVYALYFGYDSAEEYLAAVYCYGATEESYRDYLEKQALADAYLSHYTESLTYTDQEIRQYERGMENAYNSYSYSTVYLSYTNFLGESKKDENGMDIPYTESDKDVARAKAKKVAESLLRAKTFVELEKAVKALEINKENTNVAAANMKNILGSELPSLLTEWLTANGRCRGDNVVIENSYIPEAGDKVINGYYVVLFNGMNDNKVATVDVRHLLVSFVDEGNNNQKDADGKVIYTQEEKNAAKTKTEKLLEDWEAMEGGKTLANFKTLIYDNTDDTGPKETGGLYENISYDQNYIEPFLQWSLDVNRKPGDVEIIETEFGYHIMYFDEVNELNYRDLLITEEMRQNDVQKWYDVQINAVTAEMKDTSKLELDAVISG